nr:hypothetical protein [Tanacetum cinerariifolium]
MILGRSVNWVHVLDFAGLTERMRQTLGDQLSMVYTRNKGQELFTSHVWRRLFEIRAPLVWDFILEFLSTCLHNKEEMAEAGFGAYWQAPKKVTGVDLFYLRSMDIRTIMSRSWRRCKSCNRALYSYEEILLDRSLIRAGLPPG